MNKLYGLKATVKSGGMAYFMCASNEVRKLKSVVATEGGAWYMNKRDDSSTYWHSEPDVYPYYTIDEIPYVC